MTSNLSPRQQAWQTRRLRYGPKGHNSNYGRPANSQYLISRMRNLLIRLYHEGVLSEGQVAKATGLDRISIRKIADDLEPLK